MKGVILAGGSGTRLLPLIKNKNKHLLPIVDRLMIDYPLGTLLNAGVKDIIIVTGPEYIVDFKKHLGSGKKYGAKFTYIAQKKAGGTAQALALAEKFGSGDSVMVIMGDQIVEDDLSNAVKSFKKGARIFVKSVKHPERFSVAVLKGKFVVDIIEKPAKPPSSYALAGIFLYDADIFKILKKIKPSVRGELEITDANINYLKRGLLGVSFIKGFWTDAGTFESLAVAKKWAKKKA